MNLKASTACRESAMKIRFDVLVSIRAFLRLLYPARDRRLQLFLSHAAKEGELNEISDRARDRLAGCANRHLVLSHRGQSPGGYRRRTSPLRGQTCAYSDARPDRS